MTMLRWQPALLPLFLFAVIVAGCAKRPAMTPASAPAPLGSAALGPRAARGAGQDGGAALEQGAGGGLGGSAAAQAPDGGASESEAGSAQATSGGNGNSDRSGSAQDGVTSAGVRAVDESMPAGREGAAGGGAESAEVQGGTMREGASAAGSGGGAGNAAPAAARASAAPGGSDGRGGADGHQGAAQVASAAGPGGAEQVESAPGQMVAAVRPDVRAFVAIPELGDVHFDFDRYDIRPEDARILNANAAWLKANPDHLLLIEGHCDERGTTEYNLALGEHRGESAINCLISQGVQSSRMTIISYGKERPDCTDKTETCWTQNRRAHFLVKSR